MWLTVAACIFAYDCWFYVSHRILHHPLVYRNIHYIHHSIDPDQMSFRDTYVGHWAESVFQSLGVFVPMMVEWNATALLCAVVFINIKGMFRHEVRCVWIVGKHHILHHQYRNFNYGERYLDVLFGTQYDGVTNL